MIDDLELFGTLLTEDQAGVVKYLIKGNGLIAMGTGKGKTYAALCAFALARQLQGDRRLLIVGNKNSMNIWKREIKNRTPFSYSSYTAQSKGYAKPFKADVFMTQYNLVKECYGHIESIFQAHKVILVVDEIHKAKSPISDLTLWLGVLISRSTFVWGLTATLMNTHLEDIYFLMKLIFKESFKSLRAFRKYFIEFKSKKTITGVHYREVVGYRNLDVLHAHLQKYVYIKYDSNDIEFINVRVNLGAIEMRKYYLASKGILGLSQRSFAGRLPDLQQAVDNSVGDGRTLNKNLENLGAKEIALLEVLQKLLLEGEAVIVYTFHRRTLSRLRYLINSKFDMQVKTITGDTPLKKRNEIEETLEAGDVIVMTGAGGESLNLQASGVLILYSLSFSIITFIQVVGRIARMDTVHKNLRVYIIEAEGTIDTYKILYLYANADLIGTVVAPNPNLPKVRIVPSRNYIIRLRKSLLWKVNNANAKVLI